MNIAWFDGQDILHFPSVERALAEPDGLLAIGGNLSVETLRNAYENGIFPWFDETQPIMWWSPSIRAVIQTRHIHISKNMHKLIRQTQKQGQSHGQSRYQITADRHFSAVVAACSAVKATRQSTWITKAMQQAYQQLYDNGIAHSIEVCNADKQLVGGLYGVFVKNCFCGESMFSGEKNTSKLALIALAEFLNRHGCPLIDCQLPTAHLATMGAVEIPRKAFINQLKNMPANSALVQQNWITRWLR
ncbi:MAG: leucyl/phenylalanyl-tRNA--protein transferase [Gammaproteobacteria bacterium]|nr:MAG: leucyl/phenylalanyl-tRNA--protein transferase [Gammaproteobacteria bacterium]